MNFNFRQTDKKPPEFPGFYKNIKHNLVVLAINKDRGIIIESDEFETNFFRTDWCFEDTNQWTRISGKIEL